MKVLYILLLAAAFSSLTFNGSHGEEIINGRKAKKSSLLYMASVQYLHQHNCGGFLINPSYVLTAAHCYIEKYSKYLSVVLGTHTINWKTNHLRYDVESVHVHPSYKESPGFGSDIMLLKLSSTINLHNKHVKTIKISSKRQLDNDTKCQVAGWGKTENQAVDPFSSDLMEADVSIIDITVCKEEWAKVQLPKLPDNILCAGGYKTKSGACQGDSGGPLVCNGVAVGIVSFNHNYNCNYPDVPNIYTDISAYTDWIKSVIGENLWDVLSLR